MGNVARVLLRDLKRLLRVPAAWLVAIFLVVLPSLYTWFNVVGFWNPYENTGNLRVCVVNEDAGAHDDSLGDIDLGSQVVAKLHENDQLGWAFVDREQAMHEVRSGAAYAAFVIPERFSADVASIASGDFEQPVLEYYVNEKTGPVAPKITDTGASGLDTTINDQFFSTVSEAVVDIANAALEDVEERLGATKDGASARISKVRKELASASKSVGELESTADGASRTAGESEAALDAAAAQIALVSASLDKAGELAGTANGSMVVIATSLSQSLDEGSLLVGKASLKASTALALTTAGVDSAKAKVDGALARADSVVKEHAQVIAELEALEKQVPEDFDDSELEGALARLRSANDAASAEVSSLSALSAQVAQASRDIADAAGALGAAAESSIEAVEQFRASVNDDTVPAIGSGLEGLTSSANGLSRAVSSLAVLLPQAKQSVAHLQTTLGESSDALSRTRKLVDGLDGELATVESDLATLAASNALKSFLEDGGLDSRKIADFMMSPTTIASEELYELNAYGSAMAPLFINLTLWIGVFMLMVIMRLEVDDEGVERLTIGQRYVSRAIELSGLAALQAVVCCTGCLAIGVQTVNAPAFYLTAIGASLAYLSLQYALSTTLQHVGKALCVILVFVQIPAATGLYPIEMTNSFFRAIYPLFPFTYGINAMRETICGFYGNLWGQNMGALLVFLIVFFVLGLTVRPYLTNLNRMFARQIEESDIINGESVELPARRYRLSQIVGALSDRDEYRIELEDRVERYMRYYPRLKLGAAVVGIAFPIVVTALLVWLGVEKVVILTVWLVFFAFIVTFLVVVEYLRDYLSHLVSLQGMSDEEVRTLYAGRNRITRVNPMEADVAAPRKEKHAARLAERAASAEEEPAARSDTDAAQEGAPSGGTEDAVEPQPAPEAARRAVNRGACDDPQGEEASDGRQA